MSIALFRDMRGNLYTLIILNKLYCHILGNRTLAQNNESIDNNSEVNKSDS